MNLDGSRILIAAETPLSISAATVFGRWDVGDDKGQVTVVKDAHPARHLSPPANAEGARPPSPTNSLPDSACREELKNRKRSRLATPT